MRIAIVFNPKSGRGTGQSLCARLSAQLEQRGHEIDVVETGPGAARDVLNDSIRAAHRVVVIGGDGTVHHLLSILSQARTPIYHLGTGTANLIAHEFGMSRDPSVVVDHLEQEIEPFIADLPACNGIPFLLMVSVGIDASVIHRLEKIRSKKRGYRAYFKPVFQEMLRPRVGTISVGTQKNNMLPAKKQTIVISNCKSYGGGFDPSPNAVVDDQLLNAAAIPMRSSVGAFCRFALLKLGMPTKRTNHVVSDRFTIRCEEGTGYVQIDGEQASSVPGLDDGRLVQGDSIEIEMTMGSLVVYTPLNTGSW